MNKQSLPTLPLELGKFTIFAHQQILNKKTFVTCKHQVLYT